MARLARRSHNLAAAATYCVESLELYQQLCELANIAACLELAAGLARERSEPERAARLFAAAASLRDQILVAVPPILRIERERDIATARTTLGARRFAAAWAAGQALTLDEVVEEARGAEAQEYAVNVRPRTDPLTARERQVVALLARGLTNRR
jgi:ATP/maltotriose-dependent transcriptional regulator MalT